MQTRPCIAGQARAWCTCRLVGPSVALMRWEHTCTWTHTRTHAPHARPCIHKRREVRERGRACVSEAQSERATAWQQTRRKCCPSVRPHNQQPHVTTPARGAHCRRVCVPHARRAGSLVARYAAIGFVVVAWKYRQPTSQPVTPRQRTHRPHANAQQHSLAIGLAAVNFEAAFRGQRCDLQQCAQLERRHNCDAQNGCAERGSTLRPARLRFPVARVNDCLLYTSPSPRDRG